ncbi:c-type cytochrome [Olivibacter sp. SDN3]|uniref:cbb3-type cytochrome c oxidase N-terminal domain-containing protein n=1 Tax=Olivibacter sp. SDN3 TaxID=2764720 RepID=UPI0016514BE1|nr:cbb3-type cytochrome c oxidase N-terminal domain-containing protein [Olivibacter sp. SDN3]QNL48696.1 c-type cytochrome [Olivibacter sp. SDN3]
MNSLVLIIVANVQTPTTVTNLHDIILITALMVVMITVLAAALVLLKAFKTIIRVTMPEVALADREMLADKRKNRAAARKNWWNKLMGLHPLAEEDDLVIDHAYDGIRELDNPTPAWFMGLFYATIVFGAVYLSVYHVFGVGLSQEEEYEQEMLLAENERKAYLESQANNVDENTVELDLHPETIAAGKVIFDQSCMPCHGALGEGGIGPNLTDNYWLHGGSIKDIFRTIKKGVPDKGMIAWEQQLTPAQIAQVSNYISSIVGTGPSNAKAPQGELYEPVNDVLEDTVHYGTLEQALRDNESGN